MLLYYECNCNTQANIAHAVIIDTGQFSVCAGHFSKLNSTQQDSRNFRCPVAWPDGRNVRIVAKLTDIPVLVSNACHFIYYPLTHTHSHTHLYTETCTRVCRYRVPVVVTGSDVLFRILSA